MTWRVLVGHQHLSSHGGSHSGIKSITFRFSFNFNNFSFFFFNNLIPSTQSNNPSPFTHTSAFAGFYNSISIPHSLSLSRASPSLPLSLSSILSSSLCPLPAAAVESHAPPGPSLWTFRPWPPQSGAGMGTDSMLSEANSSLDEQISQLMQCKPLSEQQVRFSIDRFVLVSVWLRFGWFLFLDLKEIVEDGSLWMLNLWFYLSHFFWL